jgi:hypothetical protein
MAVDTAYADSCHAWELSVRRSLAHDPRISTVIITHFDHERFVSDPVAGFEEIWRALPRSIHDILIIRDVPDAVPGEAACVQAAVGRAPAGLRCEQPRATVLAPDAQASAAVLAGGRVHLIDLSHFFCDSLHCFPVVGGALVLTDLDHMTREFSLSLGPYMLEEINSILHLHSIPVPAATPAGAPPA